MDCKKKREEKVAAANKKKEEEEANTMEVYKEKDANMLDGNPLIAEIYKAYPMTNVDVVVGKTEEAVACVDMFNKNIAAYFTYNFPIKEVGE